MKEVIYASHIIYEHTDDWGDWFTITCPACVTNMILRDGETAQSDCGRTWELNISAKGYFSDENAE